jgi:seryl-tRNA synthetase
VADASAAQVAALDGAIAARFAQLPNLLADGVPAGRSDADNAQVAAWGADARKLGDGYMWHDELAAGFGG